MKTNAGDRPTHGEDRTLTGRVFDKGGSPHVGVQVYFTSRTLNEGATDRLGRFRLRGLRPGSLRLGLLRNRDQDGWVRIPAEAPREGPASTKVREKLIPCSIPHLTFRKEHCDRGAKGHQAMPTLLIALETLIRG